MTMLLSIKLKQNGLKHHLVLEPMLNMPDSAKTKVKPGSLVLSVGQ